MLQIKIGLVDMTGHIDPELMAAAANALNVQVTRDLPQFWPVSATVGFLPSHKKIPSRGLASATGREAATRRRRLPLYQAQSTLRQGHRLRRLPDWTIDASHEILEMLVYSCRPALR